MQAAFSRCAHCSQAIRRRTTSSLLSNHEWAFGILGESSRHYATKEASSSSNKGKSPARPKVERPTPETQPEAQPSRPVPPHLAGPATPSSSALKLDGFTPYIEPSVLNSRFDFEEDRARKRIASALVRQQAQTIEKDHAVGLSEIMEREQVREPRALFGILAGWFLRHQARNLGYGVAPDGFVRVSDVLRFPPFSKYSLDALANLVNNDPRDRFEMANLPDYIEGTIQDAWWIRARDKHSIPGVSPHSKRILKFAKMGIVEYRTQPENWPYILKNGIPEGEHHLIHLRHPVAKGLFEEDIPRHQKYLCITVDCFKAAMMGVMFYHTNDVMLYAVGTRDKGVIPLEACRSAVILDVSKETLK